jgi:hypothetical protein
VYQLSRDQGWAVAAIEPAPTPLEEVFHELTQRPSSGT